jgi:hypothetical protein
VSTDIFLDRECIKNVSLILENGVAAELVAQNDATLGLLSEASVEILCEEWVALNVADSALEVTRLQQLVHVFGRRVISHDNKIGLAEAVVSVKALL